MHRLAHTDPTLDELPPRRAEMLLWGLLLLSVFLYQLHEPEVRFDCGDVIVRPSAGNVTHIQHLEQRCKRL